MPEPHEARHAVVDRLLEQAVQAVAQLRPDPLGDPELLDEVLPNDTDSESRRARGLFRRTLLEEMGLEPKDGWRRARKQGDAPPPERKPEGEDFAGVE